MKIVGKYPLRVIGDSRGILGFVTASFCFDLDKSDGYIFVEKGLTDTRTEDPGTYETMRMVLRRPLTLSNGVVPASSVKISVDVPYFSIPQIGRRDHKKRPVGWRRTDLSDVLPTEWFVNDSCVRYLRYHEGGPD